MTTRRSVLLVTWMGGGNLSPLLALGTQLQSRGHRVAILGPEPISDRVARTGCAFVALGGSEPPDLVTRRVEDSGPEFLAFLCGEETARSARDAALAFGPDVVVVDGMHFGAVASLTAPSRDYRTAVFLHTTMRAFDEFPPHEAMDGWIRPTVNETCERLGLPIPQHDRHVARDLWDRADLAVSMLPRFLEWPDSTPLSVRTIHAGPFLDAPAPILEGAARDHVAVSLSTTNMDQHDVLQRCLDAADHVGRPTLCSTGAVPLAELRVPGSARVERWFDQSELLGGAAVSVTHAGMGSVLAALAFGVPMVCLPMGRDQDGNAARVAALGAGVALRPASSSDEIATAIRQVLDGGHGDRARALAAEVAALDNGSTAVGALEAL